MFSLHVAWWEIPYPGIPARPPCTTNGTSSGERKREMPLVGDTHLRRRMRASWSKAVSSSESFGCWLNCNAACVAYADNLQQKWLHWKTDGPMDSAIPAASVGCFWDRLSLKRSSTVIRGGLASKPSGIKPPFSED